MANRITRVYTRTGDGGTTGMADGTRVKKDSAVITAIGEVDELNAVLGLLRAEALPQIYDKVLLGIQNDLFSIGGELAMPEYQVISAHRVDQLEQQIDDWNSQLAPLEEFILPAGNRVIALCHLARTVCRRAERSLISLHTEQPLRTELMQYINRLSDYLFVAARMLAVDAGVSEVYWQKD
jgi:cob(I)alamin adenosyltransferase